MKTAKGLLIGAALFVIGAALERLMPRPRARITPEAHVARLPTKPKDYTIN